MSQSNSAEVGYIYAMVSASMEGLYKIGCSTNHPLERAKQLSASTSAASPFYVAYHKRVSFPFQAEAAIHRALKDYRVNDSREFFMIKLSKVIETFDHFDALPENYVLDDGGSEYPWANLFSSFSDDGTARELNREERRACRELTTHLATGKMAH